MPHMLYLLSPPRRRRERDSPRVRGEAEWRVRSVRAQKDVRSER